MKKDEYDEAMNLARQSTPTWKRNPSGVKQNESESLKEKAKKKLGGESHKMKRGGKW